MSIVSAGTNLSISRYCSLRPRLLSSFPFFCLANVHGISPSATLLATVVLTPKNLQSSTLFAFHFHSSNHFALPRKLASTVFPAHHTKPLHSNHILFQCSPRLSLSVLPPRSPSLLLEERFTYVPNLTQSMLDRELLAP